MTRYELDVALEDLYEEMTRPQAEDETDEQYQSRVDAALGTAEYLELEYADKVEGYVKLIKNLQLEAESEEAQAKVFKAEYDKLNKAAKSRKALAEKLGGIIANSIVQKGMKNIRTELFTVGTRKSSSVEMDIPESDYWMLPEECKKVTVEPSKTGIKEYIKSNPGCDFAHMADKYTLSVR